MITTKQKNLISSIVFSAISLGIGLLLSQYSSMITRIQSCLLIITIALFAVVLIAVLVLSPLLRKKYGTKAIPLHKSQWKSLILVTVLLIIAINFRTVTPFAVVKTTTMQIIYTIAFACMIYSLTCEFDVLISVGIIAKSQFRKGMIYNEQL